jgi:hypothetical protein
MPRYHFRLCIFLIWYMLPCCSIRVDLFGLDIIMHSNKWYQSSWSKKLENLRGYMVTWEPANISEVTWGVCDMENLTLGLENIFGRSHGVV